MIAIPAGPKSRGSLESVLTQLPAAVCARIPHGLRFVGTGQLPCNTVIEGEVDGSLEITGPSILHVAPGGDARGTFSCSDARIEGVVIGDIHCPTGAVEFSASACCTVKVVYRELIVERGADVSASLAHQTESIAADFIKAGGAHG